jgi:hypothetical protein
MDNIGTDVDIMDGIDAITELYHGVSQSQDSEGTSDQVIPGLDNRCVLGAKNYTNSLIRYSERLLSDVLKP